MNHSAAPPKVSDLAVHVRHFNAACSKYEKLAKVLECALKQCAHDLGIHAIIQSRAKTVSSFAEKLLRKQSQGKCLQHPLEEMNDLCGVRVITHTLSEAGAIVDFIEKHFQVIREETDNKLDFLQPDQFGYLSQHYVVTLKESYPFSAPESLVKKRLKAEIQVRTLLQHTWADIAHDLSYKSNAVLPRIWQRELARLAAVLEEADQEFDSLRKQIIAYAADYEAYHTEAELREELERARLLLQFDPNDAGQAHYATKLARALGDWELAIETLLPFSDKPIAAMIRDLGVCLCKRHGGEPEGQSFLQGQAHLLRAVELNAKDVDAWGSLAGSWRTRELAAQREGREHDRLRFHEQARACYRQAYETDPMDPYALGNFIEYEIVGHPGFDLLSYFRPALAGAMARCRIQTEVRLNLPWAFFDLGKFNLFLKNPRDALADYAKGVAASTACYHLDSALKTFHTLEPVRDFLPWLDWPRHLLEIARAFRFQDLTVPQLPPSNALLAPDRPVVIIAGYCGSTVTGAHRALFLKAFRDFHGTLISGGTRAGIAELVGDLQAQLGDPIQTLGYVPGKLPDTERLDERYRHIVTTEGEDFSPLEPLQYWRDLLAAPVPPDNIRLLAIGGGGITRLEIVMGLALGIRVGIVEAAGGSPQELLNDSFWSGEINERTDRLPDNRPVRIEENEAALRSFLGLA